jgi:hypothetical protein
MNLTFSVAFHDLHKCRAGSFRPLTKLRLSWLVVRIAFLAGGGGDVSALWLLSAGLAGDGASDVWEGAKTSSPLLLPESSRPTDILLLRSESIE